MPAAVSSPSEDNSDSNNMLGLPYSSHDVAIFIPYRKDDACVLVTSLTCMLVLTPGNFIIQTLINLTHANQCFFSAKNIPAAEQVACIIGQYNHPDVTEYVDNNFATLLALPYNNYGSISCQLVGKEIVLIRFWNNKRIAAFCLGSLASKVLICVSSIPPTTMMKPLCYAIFVRA
jgi:hypothetical protein